MTVHLTGEAAKKRSNQEAHVNAREAKEIHCSNGTICYQKNNQTGTPSSSFKKNKIKKSGKKISKSKESQKGTHFKFLHRGNTANMWK